ncbi:hypothetical protein KI387_019217, partial [Taxus chinensis]
LSTNNLTEPIPAELGSLSQLQTLYLCETHLTGPMPTSLLNCTALLHFASLSGMVPTDLGKLLQLKIIELHNNRFVSAGNHNLMPFLTALTNCSQLESIDVSHNLLDGPIPGEISKIVSAQEIEISSNRLHGEIPSVLENCLALEYLNLSNNALTGLIPNAISKLQYMEIVDLSSNFLSGAIPMSLKQLESIHYINLGFNNLTGIIPEKGLLPNKTLIFSPNGSLEKYLYPNSIKEEDVCRLGLNEYLNIGIDVAHGMEYLHYDCPFQVVHCDLKPDNVLLDANMVALMVTRKRPIDAIFVGDLNMRNW